MTKKESEKEQRTAETKQQLCPCAALEESGYRENYMYLHRGSCDMCGLQVLHPVDATQILQQIKSYLEAHEEDKELSLAVQHSKDMCVGSGWRCSRGKPNPVSPTSGSPPSATTPTVSSVFTSGGELSNLIPRS